MPSPLDNLVAIGKLKTAPLVQQEIDGRARFSHKKRNLTEYEGSSDIDEALVEAVIRIARETEKRVVALGPVAT